MLTISKPLSSGQAQTYHAKEFTAKEQNYWSQKGEIWGEWQGQLAGRFGLTGAVSAADFARLSQGQHPETGEQLVRQRASYEYQGVDGKTVKTMEHRAGWDATFSAPKSVSLTALVGGDDRVRDAHRESVRVALEQLEQYTQARIGGNYAPESTAKFIAAKFEHDTARPVDGYVAPQLHIRAALETQGYAVEGFAPTSRASRQLAEAGVETATLQGFLARRTNREGSERKHFYFVDESSLASTNQVREFLARLGPQDRVLLIGDTRQHHGVEAGRPFEQLQHAGMRTAQLDEIVRQKDPALKSAVESFAKGDVSGALQSLQAQGRIREISDARERIRAIARNYVESPDRTLIVSPDNASRRDLNVAVRDELKSKGTLAREDHQFKVLIQRQEMTGAERRWASEYEIGDVVRYTRGSKEAHIDAATYATVVGTNPAMNLVSVEQASGNVVTYDPRRLTGVSVYREGAQEFSVGDRIQFTAPDKSLGVANRDLAVIESIGPDRQIFARLDNGREIEFDATSHRHFDHGYAVTSHSAQGLTTERVLINADTGVHPDLLNSRFGYVSVSRASHEVTIFTNDASRLGPQLSTDVGKSSALEVNRNHEIGQAISLM
jgi:ATP-dependent exoDNAse (exonuclease V) alpha subunit